MICPKCGNDNPDGSRFCAYCGAPTDLKIDTPDGNPYREPVQPTEAYAAPQETAAPYFGVQSIGTWFLNLFLAGLPIIGFIMLLIWSFTSETHPEKKSWARAALIWLIIRVIVCAILVFIFMAQMGDVVDRLGGFYY